MNDLEQSSTLSKRIFKIRGQAVMLDMDLAPLYKVPVKRLNEQVRRNIKRFPPDFMFSLSSTEIDFLRSQFATLKPHRGAHRKYPPLAFTEEGVAMLSGILRSPKAVAVNIAIMRAFVKLRHAISTQRDMARRIERVEGRLDLHDTDIRILHQRLEDVRKRPPLMPEKTASVTGFRR
jgi:hypothetical protein